MVFSFLGATKNEDAAKKIWKKEMGFWERLFSLPQSQIIFCRKSSSGGQKSFCQFHAVNCRRNDSAGTATTLAANV